MSGAEDGQPGKVLRQCREDASLPGWVQVGIDLINQQSARLVFKSIREIVIA
jgi:hypothetical protein